MVHTVTVLGYEVSWAHSHFDQFDRPTWKVGEVFVNGKDVTFYVDKEHIDADHDFFKLEGCSMQEIAEHLTTEHIHDGDWFSWMDWHDEDAGNDYYVWAIVKTRS